MWRRSPSSTTTNPQFDSNSPRQNGGGCVVFGHIAGHGFQDVPKSIDPCVVTITAPGRRPGSVFRLGPRSEGAGKNRFFGTDF